MLAEPAAHREPRRQGVRADLAATMHAGLDRHAAQISAETPAEDLNVEQDKIRTESKA